MRKLPPMRLIQCRDCDIAVLATYSRKRCPDCKRKRDLFLARLHNPRKLEKTIQCHDCGADVITRHSSRKFCRDCLKKRNHESTRKRREKRNKIQRVLNHVRRNVDLDFRDKDRQKARLYVRQQRARKNILKSGSRRIEQAVLAQLEQLGLPASTLRGVCHE